MGTIQKQKSTINKSPANSMMQLGTKTRPLDGKNWQLHHDNVPEHSSRLIQIFLAKRGIPVIHQPPYCPDMATCDFWLFEIEDNIERILFWEQRRDNAECDGGNKYHSKRTLPQVFLALEESVG